MDLPLVEYRITRSIRESARSSVHEAISLRDDQPVIAKVFDIEDESEELRLRHEYELISKLEIDGVVKPRELRRVGDRLILVLERAPGVTLAEFADGRPLALADFWPLAIELVDILAEVHDARVIHRDIKPTNVLIDPETRRVCLADFGISVLLESERRHIYDNAILVGTLPYISPEQTGRTGHVVDYRSDLYSLGVTFYQLLTAHLPFEGLAPIELIHAHLARRPEPPDSLRRDLPQPLARLITKLLAKAPGRRYQTAKGLAADLRRMQARLAEAGELGDDFELGLDDISTTFRLPRQLYGRERERGQLGSALSAIASTGRRQIVALIGPTGIGKSSLIRDLEPGVLDLGGYMIHGKFDAYSEHPYAGFTEAFSRFFEQLLTESDARLARWRRQLLDGVGNLAGVLAELCPPFALVAGEQAPPVQLDAVEARNRLQLTIERLLTQICAAGQPIVLALDDIHWAGPDSVRMLEAIARGKQGPLLVVVTLRREQIDAEHPLRSMLASLPKSIAVHTLELAALDEAAILALLRDALPGSAELEPLAQALARKTGGVPLFIEQLLGRLFEQGVIRSTRAGWSWDQERVDAEPIPDDAAAVMRAKLDGLSEEAFTLLTRAACLGARCDLQRLALVCERPLSELIAGLVELEQVGLFTRSGSDYRFAHDSLREAASRALEPELRRRLHWTIGRALLAEQASLGDDLFDLVDHLDAGAPDELDADQRVELASLDLRAGQRALDTAAYELARKYFGHGIDILDGLREVVAREGSAAPAYALVFRLHVSLAYVLALTGRRPEADEAFRALLDWRLDDRDYAEVCARRIRILWTESRHAEAVALGIAALDSLGFPIPREPDESLATMTLTRAWQEIRDLEVDAIASLPRCTNPRDAGIVEILGQLKYPAYAEHQLYILLVGLHALSIHERGVHANTPQAIAELGTGISGELEQVRDAVALFDRAVALAGREGEGPTMARVVGINGGLSLHRGRPFTEISRLYASTYPSALELGEFDAAAMLAGFGVDLDLELGTHLRVLDRRALELGTELGPWSFNPMRVLLWLLRGVASALSASEGDDGESRDDWTLDPEAVFDRGGSRSNYFAAMVLRAMVGLVTGDHRAVFETMLGCVEGVSQAAFNTWYVARAGVLFCVAHDTLVLRGELEPQRRFDKLIARSLTMLARWARDAPANYGHYLALAHGLRAAVADDTTAATRHLDRAWRDARLQGCRWIEGQAAEQLAALLERESIPSLVVGARHRAWDAYSAWGATAKLEALRGEHPDIFTGRTGSTPASTSSSPAPSGVTSSSSRPPIDLASVLRRVGAITEELQLDQVIERILDATITSVGADRGLLVLDQGGELVLAAEAEADAGARIFPDPPLVRDADTRVPVSLINLVTRTRQSLLLDDARTDLRFAGDPYLERAEVRSLLALPLTKGERQLGALVLENRLTTHGFTSASIETLELIVRQAASTLENAQLYGALRRSEARWRSLVDGAPDLIALLDERGRVVFRNHDSPLLGLDELEQQATLGQGELALGREDLALWRETVTTVLRDGERREIELAALDDNGENERWYAVRLAPIEIQRGFASDPAAAHRNAVVVATDITARREAEQQKLVLEAQLRQQQRLESLGTLASGVAHEINNPIQGIMNYAELIQTHAGGSALVNEFADEITHESHRVASIVRNLLAFSRQDAAAGLQPVSLHRVVESSLSLIRSILRRDHIEISVEVAPDLPKVQCRAQQLQQVVMNLVTNARDALNERYGEYHERKKISIRVGPAPREGWVELRVCDRGPGIPEQVLAHIFDPFFTTKGRDQGTGLGLSVSHGIIQDHGGEIEIETELGVGTCFVILLPAWAPPE